MRNEQREREVTRGWWARKTRKRNGRQCEREGERGNAHGCKALDRGKEEAFEGEINFKREINDNEPLEDYALASTDRLAMSQLLPMTINNSNMDREVEVYNCRSSDWILRLDNGLQIAIRDLLYAKLIDYGIGGHKNSKDIWYGLNSAKT